MKRFIAFVVVGVCLAFTTPVMAQAAGQARQATVVAAVNVNVATAKELQVLPGIGRVTAARIVAYREANGKFASPEGLLKVKGLGQKTLEKIRKRIVFE